MPSLWCGATCGWRRKVFHCPQLAQTFRNSRSRCISHSQTPSLILLKMRKVQPRRGAASRLPQCRTNCPSPPAPALPAPSQTASSPPAADTDAADAHIAPPSNSCPGSPGRGSPDSAPGNSPVLPQSSAQRARCTDPGSTLLVAAPSAASPPAITDTGAPCSGKRPAPWQSPGSNGQRLSTRISLSLVPPLAICPVHLRRKSADDATILRWVNSNLLLLHILMLLLTRLIVRRVQPTPGLSRVNYICRLASISFAGSPPWPGPVAGQRWSGSWGRQTPG